MFVMFDGLIFDPRRGRVALKAFFLLAFNVYLFS